MKITCDYCGTIFDDVETKCPHCNGENPNVRKGNADNPTTIEELKEWYRQRNLPPYEVTRFFIGINTKEAKAFGIYKENGNVIVYKNKDNGIRAIRYQGTDEAFGVNEIFMRLKQEIVNQKTSDFETNTAEAPKKSLLKNKLKLADTDLILLPDPWKLLFQRLPLRLVLGIVLILFVFFMYVGLFDGDKSYIYGVISSIITCLAGLGLGGFYFIRSLLSWLVNCVNFEIDVIKGLIFVIIEGILALIMLFVSVISVIYAIDMSDYPKWHLRSGYYISQIDRDPYYYTYEWFFYDYYTSEWKLCDDNTYPKLNDFLYNGKNEKVSDHDFTELNVVYEGEEYNKSFSFPNFTESLAYLDEINNYEVDTGYYNYNDTVYYHLKFGSQTDWYYYDENAEDWTETTTEQLPDDLTHESIAEDFWFTPTWDSSTQYYDFTETEIYADYQQQIQSKSSSSSSDYNSWDSGSDYDWGSSDSWDSGSTDWGSDW